MCNKNRPPIMQLAACLAQVSANREGRIICGSGIFMGLPVEEGCPASRILKVPCSSVTRKQCLRYLSEDGRRATPPLPSCSVPYSETASRQEQSQQPDQPLSPVLPWSCGRGASSARRRVTPRRVLRRGAASIGAELFLQRRRRSIWSINGPGGAAARPVLSERPSRAARPRTRTN